jgi:hypothetical protein
LAQIHKSTPHQHSGGIGRSNAQVDQKVIQVDTTSIATDLFQLGGYECQGWLACAHDWQALIAAMVVLIAALGAIGTIVWHSGRARRRSDRNAIQQQFDFALSALDRWTAKHDALKISLQNYKVESAGALGRPSPPHFRELFRQVVGSVRSPSALRDSLAIGLDLSPFLKVQSELAELATPKVLTGAGDAANSSSRSERVTSDPAKLNISIAKLEVALRDSEPSTLYKQLKQRWDPALEKWLQQR